MSTNHSQIISKLPIVCILSGVAIGLLASIGLGSALLPSSGFKKVIINLYNYIIIQTRVLTITSLFKLVFLQLQSLSTRNQSSNYSISI